MECNCGGYYPVSTCPVCMPSKFYKDHAEELAKLLARYIALVKEDKKYKPSSYGVWAKKADIADQRILEGEALSALNNYREATK